MTCHRCRGLLVHDQSVLITHFDLGAESGFIGLMLRCINCGYVEDSVVRVNRLRSTVVDRVVASRTQATS